jgi:cytochrome c peroxidase
MHKLLTLISVGTSLLLFNACKKDDPATPSSLVTMALPAHFPAPIYPFEKYPLDPKKVELGRKLFYDNGLSANNLVSCATCHKQEEAFADSGKALSEGINGMVGLRNSPSLVNLAWKPLFMSDGGIFNLELQPIAPLTDAHEMGSTLNAVLAYLNGQPIYVQEFREAFNQGSINSQQLLVSLAQFMATMVSWQSRYDLHYLGETNVLSEREQLGLKLFKQHCSGCHKEPLTTDFSFRRNGLSVSENDLGRMRITLNAADRGKFMVPSLRNITLTGPYMHDGRIVDLEGVLNQYMNPENTEGIDELIGEGILINEEEKVLIIEFLMTLKDDEFLKARSFSMQ